MGSRMPSLSRRGPTSHTEHAPAPPRDALAAVVFWLVGVVVGLHLLLFLYYSWRFVLFPYQVDYGEGPILQIALRVAHGQTMYPPMTQGPPYVIASYMPLYYVLSAATLLVTGPSFLGGRLLAFLSAVVIALCCGLYVQRSTGRRFPAFIAGAMVLAMPIMMVWASLMRTDVVALAFSVAGFYLFYRERRIAGVILLALAVLTRWTNVAAIAAAISILVFQRRWKEAAIWAAISGALCVALVLGANALTHGMMMAQLSLHTSSSLGKSWTWQQVWLLLSIAGREWPVYFVLGAIGAVWCAIRPAHRPVAVYFAAAWAVFFTSGRIGSTFNYLMEPLAAGAMAFGILWAEWEQVDPKAAGGRLRALARPAVVACAGVLALQMVYTTLNRRLEHAIEILRPKASGAASAYVVERIREASGPVLCEDVGLNVLAGKEAPLDPFEFTQMAHKRAFDPTPVYDDVRAGKFPLIVLRFDPEKTGPDRDTGDWGAGRWPEGIIEGVRERYQLVQEAEPYLLYVPKREEGRGKGE